MKNSNIEWCDMKFDFWTSRKCQIHNRGRSYWKKPLKWNNEITRRCRLDGTRWSAGDGYCPTCGKNECDWVRPRIFCSSLADWLDEEGPIDQLARLLTLIHATPNLDWLLLTKRPQNWYRKMQSALWKVEGLEPDDDGDDESLPRTDAGLMLNNWIAGDAPPNVWIGTTVEDHQRADERIPELLRIPARIRFLSCEPLLGPVRLDRILLKRSDHPETGKPDVTFDALTGWHGGFNGPEPTKINWVICGGESGPNARPMHPDWARSLRDQCQAAGVPFLFKQWGEWVSESDVHKYEGKTKGGYFSREGKFVGWDQDGSSPFILKVGKTAAGRLLDGRELNGFPEVSV